MHQADPGFSVITVCMENLQGLQATEASVRSQTYEGFEWLVLDGASQDGTPEYLSGLDHEWLRWWSEHDQGHFDAMNKGIERARGEYLIFLNAGDRFFDGEVLTKVAHELEAGSSYEWLIGDAVDLLETGISIYKRARPLKYILHSLPSSHQAIFFHREGVGEIRYNGCGYPISADYAFGAEIYCAGYKMAKYLKFPICIFALGGISSEDRKGLMRDTWKIQRDILNVAWPFRVLSYGYRFASLFLLDNYARIYRVLRRMTDYWSGPKNG